MNTPRMPSEWTRNIDRLPLAKHLDHGSQPSSEPAEQMRWSGAGGSHMANDRSLRDLGHDVRSAEESHHEVGLTLTKPCDVSREANLDPADSDRPSLEKIQSSLPAIDADTSKIRRLKYTFYPYDRNLGLRSDEPKRRRSTALWQKSQVKTMSFNVTGGMGAFETPAKWPMSNGDAFCSVQKPDVTRVGGGNSGEFATVRLSYN